MKSIYPKRHQEASAALAQTLILMASFSAFFALAALAANPTWWSNVLNSNPANDHAVATQGQLKYFTTKAVNYMNTTLASGGGAGSTLSNMVYNWQQDYATNGYNSSNLKPSDYDIVNVGQLKYIGNQVWNRLVLANYVNQKPSWLAQNTSTDIFAANIGQLKEIFNFDLSGISILSSTDSVILSIVSGDNQIGSAGQTLSAPAIVRAAASLDGSSKSTPLTFTVNQGGGGVSTSPSGPFSSTATVTSNGGGQAAIYLQLGSTSIINKILCTAPNATSVSLTAVAVTGGGGSIPNPGGQSLPTTDPGPLANLNASIGVSVGGNPNAPNDQTQDVVNWTYGGNASGFIVQRNQSSGGWVSHANGVALMQAHPIGHRRPCYRAGGHLGQSNLAAYWKYPNAEKRGFIEKTPSSSSGPRRCSRGDGNGPAKK